MSKKTSDYGSRGSALHFFERRIERPAFNTRVRVARCKAASFKGVRR